MRRIKEWKFTVLLSLAGLFPLREAFACSVCFVAGKENINAFVGTAILLSLLPFALIGGLGFWWYRQLKARPEGSSS